MIGKTIGKYQIIDKIGEGGMGAVYKAEDTTLHRLVALKTLARSLSENPEAKERFVREAQAASSLNHPNITTVYELMEAEGEHFICMEYVEGKTIKDMAESGKVSVRRATDIIIQAAAALGTAHRKGIIHRDVKSTNIMVTLEGRVRIMDFGLAHIEGRSQLTRTGMTMGTLSYSSPEQITGGLVDKPSEVFSLGVVMYELLTGHLPFTHSSEAETVFAIVNNVPPELSSFRNDIPENLQIVVNRMLEKNPNLRYGNMEELINELESIYSELETTVLQQRKVTRRIQLPRKYVLSAASALLVILASLTVWQISISSRQRRITSVILPQIQEYLASDNYFSGYKLARDIMDEMSNHEDFISLWQSLSRVVSIETTPEQADVLIADYYEDENEWINLGQSPIDSVRIPYGVIRWKYEKDGFHTEQRVTRTGRGSEFSTIPRSIPVYSRTLNTADSVLPNMSRVPERDIRLSFQGFDTQTTYSLSSYQIDRFEVSNRQFKQFIDGGGYTNRAFWPEEIIGDDRDASWDEVVANFRDQSGRLGPATWIGGTFPEGEGDYPVRGISWFEACAYATYVGKSLPTVFHWLGATSSGLVSEISGASNYGTDGPVPVNSESGIGPYGICNMAGNVREWCQNSVEGQHFILGGAWNDPIYFYRDAGVASPLDRSETNGFRCAVYPAGNRQEVALLVAPLVPVPTDYGTETLVTREVFEAFRGYYSYDAKPLDARIDSTITTNEYWTEQRVSFTAAYGETRVLGSLFIPKNINPPYQVVIFFPGSGARNQRFSENMQIGIFDFIIMSGRAVFGPVLEGTYERKDEHPIVQSRPTRSFAEYYVHIINDVRRSIDYLDTRDDIDHDKIGYYGYSWGARVGPMVFSMENRIRTGVLLAGGIQRVRARPEADEISFLPYSITPTLMVNGTYDFIFPIESSAKVYFELLGTPIEIKEFVELPTGHAVLSTHRNLATNRILTWLDRYLGPVFY